MNQDDLKKYDFVLLIDKSGSMGEKDGGTQTRWKRAEEATIALARKCAEFDDDGITVIPFAGNFKEYKNVGGGEDQVKQIFKDNEPGGSTDTAKALKHVLDGYFGGSKEKPVLIICITDGEPTDEKALVNVIIDATKKMDADEQVGITFLQVGKDADAQKFLKRLDDNLVTEGAKFDIVDTKTFEEIEEMPMAEVLMQAILD
jgi:uncharacterized protein with von Willebrand factor type A (vWA) domain